MSERMVSADRQRGRGCISSSIVNASDAPASGNYDPCGDREVEDDETADKHLKSL